MQNYLLATEEQKELVATVKMILEKELKPRIHDYEMANDGMGAYPMDVHMKLAEAGFYGMNIAEKWGGLNLDAVTKALIVEEIAKVDAGFAFSFFNTGNFFPMIEATSIPEEEKQMWADKVLCGEGRGAFCLTEAGAGSDAKAMLTTAVKDGNEWVINGTKCFASHAPDATYFIVAAWTDKTLSPSKGVTFFFVEKERGVQIGKRENKMGLKLSGTSDVIFDNVRVPEDHVVGEVGTGFTKAIKTIENERPMNAAMALGLAEAALDCAVEYAKTRRQFGKRIIDHQGLGFMIAEMVERTESSRALIYYILDCIDKGIPTGYLNYVVKKMVSDATMETTLQAVQVLGGYGYMKDYPVEKYMRDAKIFQIFSGTNQIQQKNIISMIAGRDPEAKRN